MCSAFRNHKKLTTTLNVVLCVVGLRILYVDFCWFCCLLAIFDSVFFSVLVCCCYLMPLYPQASHNICSRFCHTKYPKHSAMAVLLFYLKFLLLYYVTIQSPNYYISVKNDATFSAK